MASSGPQTVICRYKVKPGKEDEMIGLLRRHWPALREAGLVTDEPAVAYRSIPSGRADGSHDVDNTFIEIFTWKDEKASGVAHHLPEVLAVWEPMGAICDEMDFPHFAPVDLTAR